MRRPSFLLATVFAVAMAAAACEPTEPPAFARRSSAPATPQPTGDAPASGEASASGGAGASPSVGAPTGSPRIEISGTTVTIVGRAEKITDIFPLDGTYAFKLTACPGTGVIPFIFIFEEFGQGRGQYVDADFTVKNLVGNFYLRVAGPPNCDWTVTLTKA